ncbi:MAG: DUF3833 domain-containing protein [Deltaproteobacteria bacterium]|jgi:hypothetical protein|nr:DUF3833 domain-containing protein [Deltaproteobacteria bacterium]MCW8892287.1 DUF3833 domain-containing protein [Deltaproteobacteria bacterium]
MNKRFALLISCLTAVLLISGCGSVTVTDYADRTPELRLEDFFSGQLTAHGVVKNGGGKVIRYFNADIKAYWEGPVGTLEEDFVFDDGEKQRRVWTLTKQPDGRYIGTAGDVVGEGVAEVAGNSMFLDYVLRVAYGDGSIDLTIDDRMYLVQPDILINESEMRKFGFRVGEIVLVIKKTY